MARLISFHPLLSGRSQVFTSCRGSLVVRPLRDTRISSEFAKDFMLPEAGFAQASRSTIQIFSAEADYLQNSPGCIPRICHELEIFNVQNSTHRPCFQNVTPVSCSYIFIQPEFSLLTKARNEELRKLLVQQKPPMLGSGQDNLSCCQNCAHAACRVCEALQQRVI